jgi:hypothetical protein
MSKNLRYFSKVGLLGSQMGVYAHGFFGINGKADGYTFKLKFLKACNMSIQIVSKDEIKASPEYAMIEMTQKRFDEWCLPFSLDDDIFLNLIK